MNLPRSACLLLIACLLAWSSAAQAQTCTLGSSSGISFGSGLGGSPTGQIDVAGNIVLNCTGGGNKIRRACLALGIEAPVPNPRTMSAGTGTLNFQVYDTSPAGAVIATSGSESVGMIMEREFTPDNTPVAVSFPIAGRLFAGQIVAAGGYSAALRISFGAGNIAAGACAPANLVSQGSNFMVAGQVANDCTLDIPDASFGTVTQLASPVNATTNATMTCTIGAPWVLSLDAGSTPGNTYAARRMSLGGSGPGVVAYQIYRDPGPANVWGNGTMGTVTSTGTGTGTPQSVPIYLQVPAQGSHSEGTYSDRVTATLTF